jgi:hypothetical protein
MGERIVLTQDRYNLRAFVNAVMNLGFPKRAGNLSTRRGTVSFSRMTLLD